jgi:hypothetical protein
MLRGGSRDSDCAMNCMVRGSNSGQKLDFPDQPSLLYKRYRVSFSGVKRPRRGAYHSAPCSAEVKHG